MTGGKERLVWIDMMGWEASLMKDALWNLERTWKLGFLSI
jgi:hypothetical protein